MPFIASSLYARYRLWSILPLTTLLWQACATKAEQKEVRNDIFALQTRVQQMEGSIVETEKKERSKGNTSSQAVAAANIRLDGVERDLQKIKGDVDALRIGVKTGQMPGEEAGTDESLAQKIASLASRLETIEATQAEILEGMRQGSKGKAAPGKDEEKGKKTGAGGDAEEKAVGLKDLQDAFKKNKFKYVAEHAPTVLAASKKKGQKEEVLFLYAESLFKQGNHREAALKYNDLVELNEGGEHVPQAKMRMGDCFRALGDISTAKLYYQELVQKYPKSAQAPKAKERLAKMH